MARIHKTAIARIFADLINADRIIDKGEMEFWDDICSKYGITREIETEAQKMTFAQAVNVICAEEEEDVLGLRRDLLGDCKAMTTSDGFCAHSEALIMIALIMALDDCAEEQAEVYSIPKADFNVDVATALYIEDEYDGQTNEAIVRDYRTIFKEMQLLGFHFVYLPNIIRHYRETDERLMKQILTFLAPASSDEQIEGDYRSLMGMTTASFCRDLLGNKLGIEELRQTYPALLIKIGSSFVAGHAYSNYVKVEVDGDILLTVQRLLDSFAEMLSSDVFIVKTSEERGDQFHYHGFYKQLLDIFLIRTNVRSRVVIDPYRQEIQFPDVGAMLSGVHRREKALFILLLCHGADGVNFSTAKAETAQRLQRQYRYIYGLLGGEYESTPDLVNATTRRPMIARLKNALKALPETMYNRSDYQLTKVGKRHCIAPDAAMVYINTIDGRMPLADSEPYRKVTSMR